MVSSKRRATPINIIQQTKNGIRSVPHLRKICSFLGVQTKYNKIMKAIFHMNYRWVENNTIKNPGNIRGTPIKFHTCFIIQYPQQMLA